MSDTRRRWNQLLRARKVGPACQVECAHQYLADHPDSDSGWVVLADAYWSMARYGEAAAALRRAERLVSRKDRHHVWTQWGHLYKEKASYRKAEYWYRRALRAKPGFRNRLFLGAVLARQGRFDAAMAEYQKAVRAATAAEPVDEAFYNMALVHRAQGRYSRAADYLRKAIAIDPKYSIAKAALRDVERAPAFQAARVSKG